MKRYIPILVLALALPGCAAMGMGSPTPPPALVAAAPDIQRALGEDTALHPENKNRNEAANKAVQDVVKPPAESAPPLDIPNIVTGVGALFSTIPGLTAVGALITAAAGAWKVWLTRKEVAATVDQHAALIDSVTPEAADSAAKMTTKS